MDAGTASSTLSDNRRYMRSLILALVLSACGPLDQNTSDAGVAYTRDALCVVENQVTDTCPGSGGSGTNGGGGGDAGTAVQLCESAAREQCSNLGFAGNAYCIMVFAQGCSPADQQAAINYCLAHPEIRHDADCHPQW